MRGVCKMKENKNRYSIRKYSVGASSILIATLLFLGSGQAQAAEKQAVQDEQGQTEQTEAIHKAEGPEGQKNPAVQSDTKTSAAQEVQTETTQEQPQNAQRDVQDTTVKTSQKVQEEVSEDSEQPSKSQANDVVKSNVDVPADDVKDTEATKDDAKGHVDDASNADDISQKEVPFDDKVTPQPAKDTEATKDDAKGQVDNADNPADVSQKEAPYKDTVTPQSSEVQQDEEKTKDLPVLRSAKDASTVKKDDKKKSPKQAKVDPKKKVVATPDNRNKAAKDKQKPQANKKAKQQQFKNRDPIILVHGFSGFTDDKKPAVLTHYWGGDKVDIRQDLEEKGYNVHEASVSAFGSNYDRAVELYYFIKGGRVDYGAARAAKYGHERYGETYEGVYKDWKPGQKVHLVGHSMGGQTIRVLEDLLRNGDPDEIAYQKKHGGEISELHKGNHDGMVSSITTLATPHNGTHASDLLGNEAIVRQVVYDFAKLKGQKNPRVDLGLAHWGFKQREGESLLAYFKRVKNSKLWKSKDHGFYDLTREGASLINKKTTMNPNIVYKTYSGEATHPNLLGKHKSDLNMFLPMVLTANVIGKVKEQDWRENDGLVSVVSALHPLNQPHVASTDKIKKGVWQVTPVKHDWDHADFVGQDSSDTARTRDELRDFYESIAKDLVKAEKVTASK